MSLRKRGDGVKIEWIPQRVGEDDSSSAFRKRGFELTDIYVIRRNLNIDEDWDERVLQDGIDRGGKSCGQGDDLVAGPQPPTAQLVRRQGGDRQQVGRGARVHQHRFAHAAELGKLTFELVGEPAGSQPEIECGVDQQRDFLLVENAAGNGYGGRSGHEGRRREGLTVILAYHAADAVAQLVLS